MRLLLAAIAGGIGLALSFSASAHDGVVHATPEEAARHAAETAAQAPNTAGFPDVVGGEYNLIDHFGNERSSKDPAGHYQIIFFGYANCKAICSVALPRMTQAADLLAEKGDRRYAAADYGRSRTRHTSRDA